MLQQIQSGHYRAIFAAPPCSTYSVSRFFDTPRGTESAPPIVRSRQHILGVPDVPKSHRRELHRANEITRRLCVLLLAAHQIGADIAIENPADRGDASDPLLFQFADHGPFWLDPNVIDLTKACGLESATFAQCMLGGPAQKYTTLRFSAGLAPYLRPLRQLLCTHPPGTHESVAGGVQREDRSWNSSEAASYPPDFNMLVANTFVQLITGAPPLAAPTVPAAPPPLMPLTPATPVAPAATPAPGAEEAGVAPTADAAEPTEGDAPDPPAGSPTRPRHRRRSRIPAEERFHRGLGAIRTRARGSAHLAKTSEGDPSNHGEAMRDDPTAWGQSEIGEIGNHESKGSWSYILRSEMPSGRRIVKLTWVYKTKRDGRKKSRLCVQGCTQVAGVDYDQTFCAAMRSGSLRLLCSIAARFGLTMYRWDFVAAYLQGSLLEGEVVYCSPAPGYGTAVVDGTVHMVPKEQADGIDRLCRVEKPVYGMAQAGRRWQRTIFPWLLAWNEGVADAPRLAQSQLDTCVFYSSHTTNTPSGPRQEQLYIGCYVDDLFILASHTDEHSLYSRFTRDLSERWDVEDEGEVADLLSVEISQDEGHVWLRQVNYIRKMMRTYAPEGRPVSAFGEGMPLKSQPCGRTPADSELPRMVLEAVEQQATDVDPRLLRDYQSLCGALLYCAVNTRPDVAYAVGMLCRAMGKPTPVLYHQALRVLYYLHHHEHAGLRYGASTFEMSGMSDSDWAVRHSTTGYVFTYNQAAVSWASKKQVSVALSSCEAEIMALSEAAKEGVFLRRFLDELGLGSSGPTALATDNKAARDLAYNPEHHEKSKHIERRHFYVRELVENEELVVPFVSTTANMADFFTKPLAGEAFFRLRNTIMNLPPRSGSAARGSSARARASDSDCAVDSGGLPAPAVPAERSGPPCTCCGGTGLSPPLVRARFECPACGGAGLLKDESCFHCGGRGYHVGCPPEANPVERSPAVPSAGGCCEPHRTTSPRHVPRRMTASLG